ncbi:MAG: N-acetyltransferase [Clostridia bacterium]|nr:N-acetyltransferase [Clostridia bacterium]
MKNDYTIRPETSADYSEVENLTREAFWNVYRPGCVEHYVLHRYRTRPDFIPELSLCLLAKGKMIAHVMYAHVEIHSDDGRSIPIMTFGPISVAPDFQRQGYGTILLRHSKKKAKELGAGALAITGNIGFYGKSGFVVASTSGIHYYAEPREEAVPYFLIKELEDGFLDGITGTYTDPDGYDCEGADIEAFDAQFPSKEKLKFPGQLV